MHIYKYIYILYIYLQIHTYKKYKKCHRQTLTPKNPFFTLMHVHFHTNANTSLTWNHVSSAYMLHDSRTTHCGDAETCAQRLRNNFLWKTIFYEIRIWFLPIRIILYHWEGVRARIVEVQYADRGWDRQNFAIINHETSMHIRNWWNDSLSFNQKSNPVKPYIPNTKHQKL